MRFDPPLAEGRLIRRYKRFLADVELGGATVTAHCPNTGSMLGCAEPGSRVWLRHDPRPGRKYAWTWELVEADGVIVGINTGRSNGLVRAAIEEGTLSDLAGYDRIRAEVPYGEGSRIDLLLESAARPSCWVEVKNVTAAVREGIALFPDAVTERGRKHLREMMAQVERGDRAVLCFCVQRGDVREVRPADVIDPAYGRQLREALATGVEAVAWRAKVSADEIVLHDRLPVVCP